jgi:hypothetical protein
VSDYDPSLSSLSVRLFGVTVIPITVENKGGGLLTWDDGGFSAITSALATSVSMITASKTVDTSRLEKQVGISTMLSLMLGFPL